MLLLHLSSAWVKHWIVDINIPSFYWCQKLYGMHQIPNVFKFQFFPAESIFFPILWQILKLEIMEYLIHYLLSFNVNSLNLLCKLPILFSTVKLRLGLKFFQFIHRFKIGIFWVLMFGCTSKFFPINQDILGYLNVALAGLVNFQFMKIVKKNFFSISLCCTSNFFLNWL